MAHEHDHDDHDHDHDHDGHHSERAVGIRGRLRRFAFHDHGPQLVETNAAGIRASKVSLAGLGITAILQGVLVAVTGSVALLSDTLHNVTDALTAIPLWIAFSLGRRRSSKRFTFGLNRAEDLAGLIIVAAIAVSAVAVAWASIGRLLDPRTLDHVPWVIAAGLIGALGNELVAEYRIYVGRRIASAALIADGHHARADALTSLAVVAAGIGAAFGVTWVDPVAGLVVAGLILVLLRRSAGRVFGRLLDGVDPGLVDQAAAVARSVDGVQSVDDIRMRWHGHRMLITLVVGVDPNLPVRDGHRIAEAVNHELVHAFPFTVETLVHIDPSGEHQVHAWTGHHL